MRCAVLFSISVHRPSTISRSHGVALNKDYIVICGISLSQRFVAFIIHMHLFRTCEHLYIYI